MIGWFRSFDLVEFEGGDGFGRRGATHVSFVRCDKHTPEAERHRTVRRTVKCGIRTQRIHPGLASCLLGVPAHSRIATLTARLRVPRDSLSALSHPIPAGASPVDSKRNFNHMSAVKTGGGGKVAALCH